MLLFECEHGSRFIKSSSFPNFDFDQDSAKNGCGCNGLRDVETGSMHV
jgi:hypothetical protein